MWVNVCKCVCVSVRENKCALMCANMCVCENECALMAANTCVRINVR